MKTVITLAANLRAVMIERGLSPEELAQGCSLELARVQAALSGEGALLDWPVGGAVPMRLLSAPSVSSDTSIFRLSLCMG